MGVSETLKEIKSLPIRQRWEILEHTREMLDAEIPESFKQGMREIARSEAIELDEALEELELLRVHQPAVMFLYESR
jgi:hypothetical protein